MMQLPDLGPGVEATTTRLSGMSTLVVLDSAC
jgi:hypothetical protein